MSHWLHQSKSVSTVLSVIWLLISSESPFSYSLNNRCWIIVFLTFYVNFSSSLWNLPCPYWFIFPTWKLETSFKHNNDLYHYNYYYITDLIRFYGKRLPMSSRTSVHSFESGMLECSNITNMKGLRTSTEKHWIRDPWLKGTLSFNKSEIIMVWAPLLLLYGV